jgi:hypothetical protein
MRQNSYFVVPKDLQTPAAGESSGMIQVNAKDIQTLVPQ